MIKNYSQFTNEDIRSKKISIGLKYDNLKQLSPSMHLKYNDDLKIVISSDVILQLTEGFYKALKKDGINKDDIMFENCEEIELFDVNEFTKISDYGKFGVSIKKFCCSMRDNITSLDGAPKRVGGNFDCSWCKNITSLEGAPKEVGGYFSCSYCYNLTSLEGAPEKVNGSFYCRGHNDDLVKLAKEKYGDKVKDK